MLGRAGSLAVNGEVDAVVAQDAREQVDVGKVGNVLSVSRSAVSRLAIINGSAAFLAPEMGIVPVKPLSADDPDAIHVAVAPLARPQHR